MHSFSPLCRISPFQVTLSAKRGAGRNAAGIVSIIVIDGATGVDIYEIVVVTRARRTKPPPRSNEFYSA